MATNPHQVTDTETVPLKVDLRLRRQADIG